MEEHQICVNCCHYLDGICYDDDGEYFMWTMKPSERCPDWMEIKNDQTGICKYNREIKKDK